jgi:hypothetical protein
LCVAIPIPKKRPVSTKFVLFRMGETNQPNGEPLDRSEPATNPDLDLADAELLKAVVW